MLAGGSETSAGAHELPALPLEGWEPTKDTLHLYAQVVGKVRLASTPLANQWWNVPLYVTVRGLTTGRMRHGDVSFELDFDFLDHEVVARTDRGERQAFDLRDGRSVPSRALRAAGDARDSPRDPSDAVRGADDDPIPGRRGACLL
jgi:hypothetical protein